MVEVTDQQTSEALDAKIQVNTCSFIDIFHFTITKYYTLGIIYFFYYLDFINTPIITCT